MNVLSLCSGVGGVEKGLALAGVHADSTVYVESDPYAAAVLAARVASGDLAKGVVLAGDLADFRCDRGEYDLITAGFPCQPASAAGKRLGRSDDRWIWPSIARIIAAAEPRLVFLENVRGLLTVDEGQGFRQVLESLAACGLDARWGLFRASDVGAPHRRERVFLLAHARRLGDERWREFGDVAGAAGLFDRDGAERERGWSAAGRPLDRVEDAGRAERRERRAQGRDPDGQDAGREQAAGRARESGERAVGDAYRERSENWVGEGGSPRRRGGAFAPGRREAVADPCGLRREGLEQAGAEERAALGGGRDALADPDRGAAEISEWPPGPQDAEGWRRWLDAGGPAPAVGGRLNPDFVESLMGFPPGWTDLGAGDAARRDRLRTLGNSVVPAQAALAWQVLS